MDEMILSQSEDLIVSTCGWCDAGSLWILETRSGSVSMHTLSDAKHLSLHAGTNGHFSVMHHYDGCRVCISAHSFMNPTKVLGSVLFGPDGSRFEGDSAVWRHVPKAYVAYFKRPSLSAYYLFLIEPIRPEAESVALDWFGNSYDMMYQGVIGAVDVPDENKVIISVQRDSHPILYDTEQRKVVSKLSLAKRAGNPILRFTQQTRELWASDYDTILRLSAPDWTVADRRLLQWGNQFIGDFTFNHDESLCAVARPFSGDVVALNTKRFKVTHTCKLGQQPLCAAILADGTVYGRDWKTGAMLKGQLRKKWFA